ncbi:MAG: hypothetical protein ACQETH_02750 [Candidatus Rifleibacteriota bacterium]
MTNNKNNSKTQIKLELTTPLENAFKKGILLGILLFITGISAAPALPSPVLIIFAGIVIFLLSLFFYFLTDNYYYLDIPGQQLVYKFRFLFFPGKKIIADFSEIGSVGIRSYKVKRNTPEGPGHLATSITLRYYQIVIVLNNMKLLNVSDFVNSNYNFIEKKARQIALTTGSTYVQGRENAETDVEVFTNHDGEALLKVVPLSFFKKHQQKFIFLIVYIATLTLLIGLGLVLV